MELPWDLLEESAGYLGKIAHVTARCRGICMVMTSGMSCFLEVAGVSDCLVLALKVNKGPLWSKARSDGVIFLHL